MGRYGLSAKKCSPFSEFFLFDRQELRYLLKTLLQCKASLFSFQAITAVRYKYKLDQGTLGMSDPLKLDFYQ